MKKIFGDLYYRKNLILIFCCSILITTNNIYSQVLFKIYFEGNKIFSSNQLTSWLSFEKEKKIFPELKDTISLRLINNFKREGYYFSKIEDMLIDTSKNEIKIKIDEGKQAIVKNISFQISFEDSNQVRKIFYPLIGNIFNEDKLKGTINETLTYFENNGYPFAKINIENISFDDSSKYYETNISIRIEQNEKCFVNKFEIDGNSKTKNFVITREIGIKENQLYKQSEIDNIKTKLNRLRFFEYVEEPEFFLTNEKKGILKIFVKEKETNKFDGILGYVPSSNNEKGYLTGYLNFSFENLFGTGRFFKFKWQQLNKASQDFDLRYLEPWIFSLPFNINFGLNQRKQDSTYIQRNLESSIDYNYDNKLSFSFLINSQYTISTYNELNSFSLSYGLGIKNDSRNEIYSSTSGIFFNGLYKYVSKTFKNFIFNKTALQKIEFDISFFNKIFNKQVVALSIHAREIKGDLADISDLYFLGGTNTLRGYREKQYLGNRTLWTNLEYRFLLSKYSYGYIFFDTGYYQLNKNLYFNLEQKKDFKVGYGFGLNLETGIGIMGISFALGKGDSFTDGKIHFGIMNEF